jgi:hypothetical protein
MSLCLHFLVGMLESVEFEDHCDQLLGYCFRKSFAKADAMTPKERSVCIRVARFAIGCFKVLRIRIKALRNVLVMPGAPLAFIVMQKAHHDMNLLTRLDFQLFLGSLCKNDVSRDSMRS